MSPTGSSAAAHAPPGLPAFASAPTLAFRVQGGEPMPYAAAPTLRLRLEVECVGGGALRSLALNVQVRIAATLRQYAAAERERLVEVFGPPEQWGRSLHSLLWTQITVTVPAFEDSTVVDLPVPCTYDFEVASAKYLDGLKDGMVPLELLFSGTVFDADADGRLRVTQLSWNSEARYTLPVQVWRDTMDQHFPDCAWLRLDRATFERLAAHRARGTLLSWEETIEDLMSRAEA